MGTLSKYIGGNGMDIKRENLGIRILELLSNIEEMVWISREKLEK
jgi:hypothetical protein